MLRKILIVLIIIAAMAFCYGVFSIQPTLPTEILSTQQQVETPTAEGATPTATPTPTPTRVSPKEPLEGLSWPATPVVVQDNYAFVGTKNGGFQLDENGQPIPTRLLPRHGLIIAFVLPVLVISIIWGLVEVVVIRFIQPRGVDLSSVLIKARDGLFVEAVVSMTARRMLTPLATRLTWPSVRAFVEKPVEQELIHQAISFVALEELEQNLKTMTEKLYDLPIIEELARDFGLEVIRFNIEIRYTAETREALRRKAEASAGGSAYLAYAAAAHLDPERPESRELYRIYQETSSQVDAYRNLGSGFSVLADYLRRRDLEDTVDELSIDDDE